MLNYTFRKLGLRGECKMCVCVCVRCNEKKSFGKILCGRNVRTRCSEVSRSRTDLFNSRPIGKFSIKRMKRERIMVIKKSIQENEETKKNRYWNINNKSVESHSYWKLYVPVTVHREQSMKTEDQKDATIRCLLLTSVSTCFGHHCAHLQWEQRPCYCIWCIVLVLLDVVGSGCGALRCGMRAVIRC